MRPPEDASLPWRQGKLDPHEVYDANGYIAIFSRPELAAYAVAAVNATPGLAETLAEVYRRLSTETHAGAAPVCWLCELNIKVAAALEALPKEAEA